MKKILCLCLSVLMLSALVGCNITPPIGVDSSGLEPFVVGGIGPLTEERGKYGLSVYQGAQLAVEEINATGGVNGFRLVLNYQDSKADPETVPALYDKLMDNNMKVLLGGVFSDETEALLSDLSKDGILTLTSSASQSTPLSTGGNLFRVCYSDARIGTIAANFISDHRLTDRLAVIWSDDVFGGTEQVQAFVSTFTSRGGFTDLYEISGETEPDFTPILTALEQTPPSMIYLATSPELSRAFLQEYSWDGSLSPVKIFGGSGMEYAVQTTKNPDLIEGLMVVTPFSSADTSPLVQNFVSAYREAYQQAPDRYAAEAYDGVYALAEAMKKAGITPENVDNDDFHRKMVAAMTKITVNGVTGTMSWTADGETTRSAVVKVVKDGVYTPFIKEDGT